MALGMFAVHAGDFAKANHHQFVGGDLVMKSTGRFFRETIKLSNLQSIEIASEESVKRIGGTAGWGLAGAVLLGPIGLLAGLIGGGQGKNVTFVCGLNDGRKFMATAPSEVYTALSAAIWQSEFDRSEQNLSRVDGSEQNKTSVGLWTIAVLAVLTIFVFAAGAGKTPSKSTVVTQPNSAPSNNATASETSDLPPEAYSVSVPSDPRTR